MQQCSPEEYQRIISQHLQSKTKKELAEINYPLFATYYLGLDLPRHQEEWYDILFKYPLEMLLSPRDHGKTTVLPRIVAEHDPLYTPNHNILLLSKTYKQAKKSLKVIDKDLTRNERILNDFELELMDYEMSDNQIFFNQEGVQRDATIESNGILGDVTGGHFQKIILDDIIDDANSITQDNRDKVWSFLTTTILPLLEPGGSVMGIGTRKHYDDCYHKMKENPMWYVVEQKAILKMPEDYDIVYDKNGIAVDIENIVGDYEVLWEAKWDIKTLLLQKAAMGTLAFNREYQNDASLMRGKILKDYWLKNYVIAEKNIDLDLNLLQAPPLETMTIYQGWDLAIRKGEANDYLVCSTLGVTKDNNIYVLDWYRDKIDFPAQVKMVQAKYDEFSNKGGKIALIGIESNNYQVALKQQVLQERVLPIKEIISINDKATRIIAGSVNYENGLVHVPIDHPLYRVFMDEYSGFDGTGKGIHDDMVDSMDIAMRLIFQPPTVPFKRGMRGVVNG